MSQLGIFQPFTWEEGIIVDNAISTTNQSNTSSTSHQRTTSIRNSADQNAANSSAVVGGDGLSKNMGVGGVSDHHHPHSSPTPPLQRRLAKSFSVAPSQTKGSYHIFHFLYSLCALYQKALPY